jgi:hypothetical protein
MITKLIIIVTTILSYLLAFISAIVVFPYLWLPIGLLFGLLGAFWLYKYTHKNRGVLSVAIFTNGTFVALGQYLETVVPAVSIIVNILGVVLTLVMMMLFYYWKEGQRHVQVRVKQEKMVIEEEISSFEKLRLFITLLKKQRTLIKSKGYPKLLAFQFALVEYHEERANLAKNNAIDFVLGKEVILQRNEYDQSTIKSK